MADKKKDVAKLFKDGREIDEAMRQAVREAVRTHHLLGRSVVTWRDGKVVRVPPGACEH
ncbi:hypothetical protein [Alkalilimnicola ehrlichii]|nr:hypothetical protein [Alkalilimnicola ehrlichii]